MSKSEDLSEVFTPEGIQKLEVGQLLVFNYEGSRNEYKITKLDKQKGIVKAVPVTTYAEDEIDVNSKSGYRQTVRNYAEQEEKIKGAINHEQK